MDLISYRRRSLSAHRRCCGIDLNSSHVICADRSSLFSSASSSVITATTILLLLFYCVPLSRDLLMATWWEVCEIYSNSLLWAPVCACCVHCNQEETHEWIEHWSWSDSEIRSPFVRKCSAPWSSTVGALFLCVCDSVAPLMKYQT